MEQQNNLRHLTRREQLEYYINFLMQQKMLLEQEINKTEDELKLVRGAKNVIRENNR